MPKKESIRNLFNNIAPKYDQLNRLMSFGTDKGWRRKAVREIAQEQQPVSILDVASGTADFAIDIAQQLHDESHIIGVDISEQMLEVGRKKIEEKKLTKNITLQVADAENLPFENERFNYVTVAFGVRNFENLTQGLTEMYRVLNSQGKLIILELSYPDSKFLLWFYKIYTLHIIPFLCGRISGNKDAYRYLPKSVLQFPKPAKLVPMLQEIGFTKVNVKSMTFGVCLMYICEK